MSLFLYEVDLIQQLSVRVFGTTDRERMVALIGEARQAYLAVM